MQFTTEYSGTISIIWDGEAITQVTLGIGTGWQKAIARSYLEDGQIIFSREDAPAGTIWALNKEEMEEISLMGGPVKLYADDLYSIRVIPEWWSVECQMAAEGECPEWPLAEENIGGEDLWKGFSLFSMLLQINDDESQDNWDGEEDEGPDFV
jgi:hypothetical protein